MEKIEIQKNGRGYLVRLFCEEGGKAKGEEEEQNIFRFDDQADLSFLRDASDCFLDLRISVFDFSSPGSITIITTQNVTVAVRVKTKVARHSHFFFSSKLHCLFLFSFDIYGEKEGKKERRKGRKG